MDGELLWLQSWYLAQCDGDWERDHAIEISALVSPGCHS